MSLILVVEGNRSVEGTIAFFFCTILPLLILNYNEYIQLSYLQWFVVSVATICSGWVEAKTDQVDNLVLPLIFYIITCTFF